MPRTAVSASTIAGHLAQRRDLAAALVRREVAQREQLVARHAAAAHRRIVEPVERVRVQPLPARGRFDTPHDRRGRLARQLLVEDRARERVGDVERLAPARVGLDRADALHPGPELAVLLRQMRGGGIDVEAAAESRHAVPPCRNATGRETRPVATRCSLPQRGVNSIRATCAPSDAARSITSGLYAFTSQRGSWLM
jgi:hypothetical protein